jgi:putative addiction module CopG family antidote
MEITLSPAQQAFVRDAVASGRYASEQDAVQEALDLWEERQRRRAEILSAVDAASAELEAGQGIPISEDSMQQLSESVKRRGQERLLRPA